MKSLARGQRVRVMRDVEDREVNAVGTVSRIRFGDDAAWIALDERHVNAAVHPFPATTTDRATLVLATAENCERA